MIEGHKELGRKFATLEQIADQQMERIVKNQLKHVQAAAKLLCPVSQGELRNSIRSSVQRVDDRVVGTVYTNKAYAPYVEFGTGTGAREMGEIKLFIGYRCISSGF